MKDKAVASSANIELDWVRDIINQTEAEEEEEKPVYEAPPAAEKKQLTSEERSRVQPAGEFIMNLTKAMQRSGYYSEDHPESKGAKHGLYEELQKALGDSKELMITNQETREKTDILITGILDQPVSVRTVIGPGMAEMFVPRLREYFNRKALVSFALKKEITPEHFDSFVDIMSDPQVDKGSESGVGELLTNALVDNSITEISTVFMDDMLVLEEKFPWRVEMAIQRLAKDLKVLPMFKGKSDQELKKMKHQTVMDIIRPVMHPQFLKDILINTYIIARHVKTLELTELEELIIDSLPPQVVLPTSTYVLEEMKRLQEKQREHPDSQVLELRIKSIKRILKSLSRRLVLEEIKGGRGFLEELYFNEILTLEELPPEVRARVNTLKLAESVKNSAREYARAIAATRDADEAYVLLECFKKVSPVLVEQGAWQELLTLVQGISKASESSELFQGGEGLPAMPLIYIFSDHVKDLARGYLETDKESRALLDKIVSYLGPTGVAVMGEVLLRSEDRGVRKAAVESLVNMREKSLYWVRHVLDDSTQPWYVQRNALLILSRVGREDEDRKRARRFLNHSRPRLREEALTTVLRLEGKAGEDAVFKALDDEDTKVVGRAASSLTVIQPLSGAAAERILQRLRVQMPKDKEEAKEVAKKTAPLIRSLANLTDIPRFPEIEDALVELLKSQTGHLRKGFLKRIRNVFEDEEEPILLQALVDCLARIGGEKALPALEPLQDQEGDMGSRAQKAAEKIRLRTEGK
ncbi:MAG: HEAT repeat domain-containing protein [bacterium]